MSAARASAAASWAWPRSTSQLPATSSQDEVESAVDRWNADERVDGILVQLPLPGDLDFKPVLERIDPAKDVDGFHPINVGRLVANQPGLRPCTPAGVMELLRAYDIPVTGADAVVVGRSDIVGKPVALLLLHQSATVTIAHSRTRDLGEVTRRADILVAAVGRPQMITGDMIKPGATVIDVGINRTDAGLVGDVDFESASQVAGAITPVPGGVGPMTIAMLLSNTLEAARLRQLSRDHPCRPKSAAIAADRTVLYIRAIQQAVHTGPLVEEDLGWQKVRSSGSATKRVTASSSRTAVRTCSCTSRRSRATATRAWPRVSGSSSRSPRGTRGCRPAQSARSDSEAVEGAGRWDPAPDGRLSSRSMAISSDDVLHVARLANLSLSDDEVARMSEQLSGILGHVDALAALDLEGVPPTAHALEVENVTRPDRPRPSWPRDEVLANAPAAQDGAFRVPPTS